MDRRVRYTKQVLNETLIRFLEQKELAEIMVTELCRAADVNRSTYYAHFADPYDQLTRLKEELLRELTDYILRIDTAGMASEQVYYVLLKALVDYVDSKKQIFRILLCKSGDHNLQEQLLNVLGEKAFLAQLEKGSTEEEARFLLMYVSNGCFGLFYHWLQSDDIPADLTAKRMADFTGRLL